MKNIFPLLSALCICLLASIISAFFYEHIIIRCLVIAFGVIISVFTYKEISQNSDS